MADKAATVQQDETDGAGKFYLINVKHGTVLDVAKSDRNPGAKIVAWPKNKTQTLNQIWYLDDAKHIRSALNDFVIHVDKKIPGGGHYVCMEPFDGQPEGAWTYEDQKIMNAEANEVLGISQADPGQSTVLSSQYVEHDNQLWKRQYVPL